ncbi:hypothetical protein [Methylomagnum ishizawai]|uniref:hypothetical protein n=1 Tax=Methylomagnum ishizawai TaxID=1760988 RepID=UPI000A14BA85|nr:hypothetical protein [Methylomagnum ishizawai]
MKYLRDTNVVSELRKKARANPDVQRWFSQTPGDALFISVLTVGELRGGVERIRRRDEIAVASLEKWLQSI